MATTHSKVFLALSMAFIALGTPARAAPSAHEKAVTDARAGQFDTALPVLEELVQNNPAKRTYRYDWIAVLSWAGRHAEALQASQGLRLSAQTPDYVLAAIGKSGLDAGQPEKAVSAYSLLAQRKPRDADATLGWALALLADQKAAQADLKLRRVLQLSARSPAQLNAAAAALTARNEPARAQPFQLRLQALGQGGPATKPVAVASSILSTTQPSTATNDARDQSQLAARELATRQEQNGAHIRDAEAQLGADFSAARYALIDAALAENASLVTQARAMGQTDVLRRLRFDRVVALRDRRDAHQALEEFAALEAEGEKLPPYVLNAAADAAMQLRQPERARALYQQSLATDPANMGTQTALMYAHLETENFPAAEQVVGALLDQTQHAAATRRTEAALLRFADRLNDAELAVAQLAKTFPNDAGIWLAEADLLAQRGRPRAAAERYAAVLAVEPLHIAARVGLADATWAQGDIAEAGRMIQELETQAPEHPAVQRIARAWQRRQAPMLTTTATQGFGQGVVAGNDDLVWESTVYSGQTAQGLRVFGNHHLAKAKFNGASASHERAGMGLEWTRRDVQATLEVGRDLRNAKDAVWALGAGWQVNDQVSLRARHESQTNDFPLKGRLPDAESGAPTYLHANKSLVGAAYRWNESRRVAADLAYYDFNDGNQRKSLSVTWFERLYSGYGRTLDLQTAAYTSSNTLQDAVYFNPKRDVALSATLSGDWQTWRRYERTFNQRVAVTLGTYRQQSDVRQDGTWIGQTYGWNAFQDVRYEHEWQWGPDRSARYGVGARRFPYDGRYETKSYLYLNLNWRF